MRLILALILFPVLALAAPQSVSIDTATKQVINPIVKFGSGNTLDGTGATITGFPGSSYSFAQSLLNTAGTVTLLNDSATPGNSKYYGTDSGGTRGYFNLPSSGGNPGGSNTQVQFNDSNAFGGDSGLTYNKTTDLLSVGQFIVGPYYYVLNNGNFHFAAQLDDADVKSIEATSRKLYKSDGTTYAYDWDNALFTQPNTFKITDSGTTNIQYPISIVHDTSGTPGDTFGVGIAYSIKDTVGVDLMGTLDFAWSDPVQATRTGFMTVNLRDNGAIQQTVLFTGHGGLSVGEFTFYEDLPNGVISGDTGYRINNAAPSGKILKGNGTNYVASTETYAAPGTSGNVMTSDGTNWTSATPPSRVGGFTAHFSRGGAAIQANDVLVTPWTCPYSGTITGYSISADTGTCTLKTWKKANGTAIPTIADVISTSGVALSSGTHIRSSTVSDFTTTTVTAGDMFMAQVTATSGPTDITFQVEITR